MKLFIRFACALLLLLTSSVTANAENSSSLGGMDFAITSRSQKTCTLKAIKYIDEPKVVIPDSAEIDGAKYCVTSISAGVFKEFDMKDQIKAIVLPSGITELRSKSFMGCEAMESIALPKNLKKIGEDAFIGCSSLKSIILPIGLDYIGAYAFKDCSSLVSVMIPANVTALEQYTFAGCKSLAKVTFTLPSRLQRIDDSVFYECASLTSIKIPKSCKIVNIGAFFDSGLKSLLLGRNTQIAGDNYELPYGCQAQFY